MAQGVGTTNSSGKIKKKNSGTDLIPIIEPANLFRIERGEVNPSIYLVKQICDFLEIDFSELYQKTKKSLKS